MTGARHARRARRVGHDEWGGARRVGGARRALDTWRCGQCPDRWAQRVGHDRHDEHDWGATRTASTTSGAGRVGWSTTSGLLISTTAALGCAVATLVDCSRPWLALDLHHDCGCSRLVCARPGGSGGWPLQGCAPLSTSPSGHNHGYAEPCAPVQVTKSCAPRLRSRAAAATV